MDTMVWHLAKDKTQDGYYVGLLCARTSSRSAWTGRAAQTLKRSQVTCKRCLAKMAK